MRTVGFLTMEKLENRKEDSVGSSRIRAAWVWKYWPEAEEYHIGKKYDVLILQKAYSKSIIESFDGIKIFDLCDPDWLDPRPVVEMAMMCDAVTTSTEALAVYLRRLLPKEKIVKCIPDRIDLEAQEMRSEHTGNLKSVVWMGYSRNTMYLEKALPFIARNNVKITAVSDSPYILPGEWSNRIELTNVTYSYPAVNDEMKRHDAALLPTPYDLRGQFKSNNKTLQAWSLGLPVIQQPEDFEKYMTAEARNEERKRAYQEIVDKWDVKQSVQEYKDIIADIAGKSL